jgi:fatty acid desaturase
MVAMTRVDPGDRAAPPGEDDIDAGRVPWPTWLARVILIPVLLLAALGLCVVAVSLGVVVIALALALLLPLAALALLGVTLFAAAEGLAGNPLTRG